MLRDFWMKYKETEEQLKAWYRETENAQWRSPAALKALYPSASIIAENRVVFNIKGNKYRLVVRVNYAYGIVWIRFIGSHHDYSLINVAKI
ncbi:MAG: type II toxin-antitoxin system HigB family toxin [Saprospiraceae bacterium]